MLKGLGEGLVIGHFQKSKNTTKLFVCLPKFYISIVFIFSWHHSKYPEKMKTMFMQIFLGKTSIMGFLKVAYWTLNLAISTENLDNVMTKHRPIKKPDANLFLTTRKQNKMVNCRFKMRAKDAVNSRRHEFYCFLAFWLATYSSQQKSHWLKGWQLKLYLSELLLMLKIGQRACENLDSYCKNFLCCPPYFSRRYIHPRT